MRISDWSSDVCSSDLPGESQARSLAPIPSFIAPPVLSGRFAGRLDGNPGGRFFICCPAHAVGVKIIMKINLFDRRRVYGMSGRKRTGADARSCGREKMTHTPEKAAFSGVDAEIGRAHV